jgi:uncharacterized membrane protein YphA (DoxX/SURF4 family)
MFPSGPPGVGLLLLRFAVGLIALGEGVGYLTGRGPTLKMYAFGLAALVIGSSLLIGFLTPKAAVLAGGGSIAIALSWLPAPTLNPCGSKLGAAGVVVMAAALACLGPGAFSLDARRFGRREIVVPHIPRPPRP